MDERVLKKARVGEDGGDGGIKRDEISASFATSLMKDMLDGDDDDDEEDIDYADFALDGELPGKTAKDAAGLEEKKGSAARRCTLCDNGRRGSWTEDGYSSRLVDAATRKSCK